MKKSLLLIVFFLFVLGKVDAQLNLDNQYWFQQSPQTAWVAAMKMAPSNSNYLVMGTYADGVYKSIDKGATWVKCEEEGLPTYDAYPNLEPNIGNPIEGDFHAVYDIIYHPTFSENEFYVAHYSGITVKTEDGGNTWTSFNDIIGDSVFVLQMSINPDDANDMLLYLTSTDSSFAKGLYKTTNGGQTVQLIETLPNSDNNHLTQILRDPNDNKHVLASFRYKIFESFDNGSSWEQIITNDFYVLYYLHFDNQNSQNLWAIMIDNVFTGRLVYSENGGKDWIDLYNVPGREAVGLYVDGENNLYIEEEKSSPLYTSILKSSDNGVSWTEIDKLNKIFVHDITSLSLINSTFTDPYDVDNVFFGNSQGIFVSFDGGSTLNYSTNNLTNTYVDEFSFSSVNNDIMYLSSLQGLWKSIDGGINWDNISLGSFGHVFQFFETPDSIYVVNSFKQLLKSTDGGNTFDTLNIDEVSYVEYNKANETLILHRILGYGINQIYISGDYGQTWEFKVQFPDLSVGTFNKIIINPSNPDSVFLGKHLSIDGGETWSFYEYDFEICAIDPVNHNVYYAKTNNTDKLYKSIDYGVTFNEIIDFSTEILGGNIRNFKISEENSNYLFFGTYYDGIQYSYDAGETWQRLPGAYSDRARDIVPFINENKYYVATYGEGVWVYDTTYVGMENPFASNSIQDELTVYPNPFKNSIYLRLNTGESGKASVSMYNMQGQLVYQTEVEFDGQNAVELRLNEVESSLNQGVYFVSVEIGQDIFTSKIFYQ